MGCLLKNSAVLPYTHYSVLLLLSLQVEGNNILYTNAVLDSKVKSGGLRFFDSIKIPFQCRLTANRTISQGLNPVPNRLIMRIDGAGPLNVRYMH